MIKVLLADSQDLVRSSIKLLLSDVENIDVVGEARSGEEVIQMGRQLKPDIILMYLDTSGIGGLEAIRRLLRYKLISKLLILSGYTSGLIPARLVELGIAGYLSMQANHEEMVRAIQSVYAGNMYIDKFIAKEISAFCILENGSNTSPFMQLTARELQVLMMFANGIESNDIAKKLFLSKKTIHGYLCYVLKKIGARTDVEAALIAIKNGVIAL